MYFAPAAAYPVGRSPHHAYAIGILAFLDFATISWVDQNGYSIAGVLVTLLSAAAVIFAGYSWWHAVCGTLRWSGQRWLWSGWPGAGSLQVLCVLDLQDYCLLRLTDNGYGSLWIPLYARSGDRAPWQAMRRALMASAGGGNLLENGVQ